jgi:hypothetical protein
VLVLTESGYLNWKEHLAMMPIYKSGLVTAADVSVQLPGTGTYYVVLSNPFSTSTPSTVEGDLTLAWRPSAAVLAQATLADAKAAEHPPEKTSSTGMLVKLLAIVVAGAFAGGSLR